jgi:uncharacterized RDD family membrane protein YckC
MSMRRAAFAVLMCGVLAGLSASLSAGQAVERQEPDRRVLRPEPDRRVLIERAPMPPLSIQIEPTDYFRYRGRAVFRLWQDYFLKPGDEVRHVAVVFGNATIEGRVNGDLVVVFGEARLAGTARVDGAVVVVGGTAVIAEGAIIRSDLVVVGGGAETPATFTPGGEHIVIGAPWLGDSMRAFVPYLTRGLLWGRLIVPGIGWVWTVVLIVLIVSVAINALFHQQVGAVADQVTAKPFSAFLVGLLVLLLVGPISVLLAATVVGLVVLPALWAALAAAWIVGKVGVTRVIGRGFSGATSPEPRPIALRSLLIGFVAIMLLYMVPVLGIMTWALTGVFGLGAATQTFLAALRRERPRPPAKAPVPPEPPPVVPPVIEPPAAAAFSDVSPPAPDLPGARAAPAGASFASAVPTDDVAGMPVPPPPTPAPSFAAAGAAAGAIPGDLSLMPRATFLDRFAAFTLDAVLVLIATAMLDLRREDGAFFVLLFVYCVAFWTWKGTTIGGIICNLRVIRTNGQPLRYIDALVRGLSSLFSFAALGLGVLWILRDPERQSWHDKIAGTYVVTVPRSFPLL